MTPLLYLDDMPIEFDEDKTLAPALKFLDNMTGNVDEALDQLLRDVIGDLGYSALRSYPVTSEEMDAAVKAVQMALYGLSGADVASEYGWVADHLEDIDADFMRFYRLDYRTLPARRFFDLTSRLGVYGGVLSTRIKNAEAIEDEPDRTSPKVYLDERLGNGI